MPDGLTELRVNRSIADLVADGLRRRVLVDRLESGMRPDRLPRRRAGVVHADSCEWINDQATGFKVAASVDTSIPDRAQR
jgi:N-acetylmuramoyl-L-alanine amidase